MEKTKNYSIAWYQIRSSWIRHGLLSNELPRPTRKHTSILAYIPFVLHANFYALISCKSMIYITDVNTYKTYLCFYSKTNEVHQFLNFISLCSSSTTCFGLSYIIRSLRLYIQHQVKQILLTAC